MKTRQDQTFWQQVSTLGLILLVLGLMSLAGPLVQITLAQEGEPAPATVILPTAEATDTPPPLETPTLEPTATSLPTETATPEQTIAPLPTETPPLEPTATLIPVDLPTVPPITPEPTATLEVPSLDEAPLAAPQPTDEMPETEPDQFDIFDLAVIASRYGSNDPEADLNRDGVVNILDLTLAASRYGQDDQVDTPVLEDETRSVPELPTAEPPTAPIVPAELTPNTAMEDNSLQDDGLNIAVSPAISEESALIEAAAVYPVTVQIRVTIHSVRKTRGGEPEEDFYPKIWIDGGQTYKGRKVTDSNMVINPGWSFAKEVNIRDGNIPIKIELWEDDSGFRWGDDQFDITPRDGSALTPDLYLENCAFNNPTGSRIGTYAQALRVAGSPPRSTKDFYCNGTWTAQGGGKDSARIEYTIEVRGLKYFDWPVQNGIVLDACLYWGQHCGQTAAHAFCTAKGFDGAARFKLTRWSPTFVPYDRKTCTGSGCDALEWINCYTGKR